MVLFANGVVQFAHEAAIETWDMWLDEERGLLFVWKRDKAVCVYHVMDVEK